ncbi:MAG: alpha-amylase [Bacteroidales bacterium]|nr:alpha-amylase [Bacteroidales bacterium]
MKRALIVFAAFTAAFFNLNAQPVPGSFEQNWKKGPEWLRNAVIYQVYPSSFKDSDGNGIGDIPGVISKLNYIESLGVAAIWFNPLFESGWIDGGYDVIDFYKVDPRFGTNNDLVELVQEAHARGIKVMLDLVAGHTSDKHPWFIQSGQDSNLQYSDYYIWSDRLPDVKAERDLEEMLKDPNFMQNTTGKWMKSGYPRAKYYYKNFYACQPALNYGYAHPDPSHPWEQSVDAPGPRAVRQELKDILAFWYSKGVDGFRVDMASSLVKNDRDKREIMRLWREIREWSDVNYPERVLMAEWNDPKYCLAGGFNVDMNLNSTRSANRQMYFDRKHQADGGSYFSLNGGAPSEKDLYGNPWPEEKIDRSCNPADMLKQYYDYITDAFESTSEWGYFATITGNHDHLRFNTGARNTPEQLKVMMAWVLTMPLPILYYGDEIGIRSLVELPNVEGANHNGKERAGGRSPMQWDASANAGFSTCAPENIYIPVCPEWTPATSYPQYLKWKEDGCKNPTAHGAITVESQDADPESLLNWTRALIALRKGVPALWADARFEPVFDAANPYPMVYRRTDGNMTVLVVLNPTGKKHTLALSDVTSTPIPLLSAGKASYKTSARGTRFTMGPTSALIVAL